MAITLQIVLSGCNGSSDSPSELAESYDGVYKDISGESLFIARMKMRSIYIDHHNDTRMVI